MGEIVITHNKAIKVILLRKTSADMGSTLQQGGIGRRASAIFQTVFYSPPLSPAAQCKWASTPEESETSDETKEDAVSSH